MVFLWSLSYIYNRSSDEKKVWCDTGWANITLSCSERSIWLFVPTNTPSCLLSHCARASGWVPVNVMYVDVTVIMYWKCFNWVYLRWSSSCFCFSTRTLGGNFTELTPSLQKVQTEIWGPHNLFNGYRGSFWDKRRPWCDAKHSPPSSVEVKNMRSHTSTPPTCLHVLDRNAFIFTFRFTLKPIKSFKFQNV